MSGQWSGGKGDRQRPRQVSREMYELNYDLAFGFVTKEEYEKRKRKLVRQRKRSV